MSDCLCHDCQKPMEVIYQGSIKVVTCKDATCTLYGVTLSISQYQALTEEQYEGYRKVVAGLKAKKQEHEY